MSSFKNFSLHNLLGLTLIALLMIGCIPQKKIQYLQDFDAKDGYANPYTPIKTITGKYFLRPNDYVSVAVSTPNPEISKFFNPTDASSTSTQNQSTNSKNRSAYMIDDEMNISLPIAGKINLAGCNIIMAQEKIKVALKKYIEDAYILVNLDNNYFTILGEAGAKGIKYMPKDQITIFEALALSGDLTVYAKKSQVKIVRPTNEGTKIIEVNVLDKNIIDTESYYIYPNDMIYTKPMRAKMLGFGETLSLGWITAALALYLTINSLVNN